MRKEIYGIRFGIAILSCISCGVQASDNEGLYGGIGLIHSGFIVDEGDNAKDRDQSVTSAGVYAGYKKHFTDGFFVSGEIFYNDSSSDDTFSNGEKVSVDSQYGLKANIGYEWGWGGSAYGILGAAHYGYEVELSPGVSDESQFGPLYGAGFGYRIGDAWSTHFEVTAAGDEIEFDNSEDLDSGLILMRLGISYHL